MNGYKHSKLIIALFLSITLLQFIPFQSVLGYENKKVLVLNSYHDGYNWTEAITEGIKSELSGVNDITLFIEYMDTKRIFNKDYLNKLSSLYQMKYGHMHFDLILCADNNAFDFILERHGKQPYKAPVVFCGINNYKDYNISKLPVFGITESFSFDEELTYIFHLFPDTKHVYYIFDQTETGNIYYRELNKLKKQYQETLTIHLINEIDVATFPAFLASIPSSSVIRYINSHKDKFGQPISDVELAKLIANNASVPVLGGEIGFEINGFLGGLVNIGHDHGAEAARLGLQILQSKAPPIKKIHIPEPQFYINYQSMKRFGIGMSDLPAGSVVINGPTNLFYKYRHQILALGIFVVSLVIIIFALMVTNNQRKKTQKDLLIAKKKAEEADNLKSAFLANMSHEIRTPLNSIVGFSKLLADRHRNNETSERYIQYINSSSDSLLNLINDILDISKIEVGQLRINKQPIEINKELESLYSIFDHELFKSKKYAVSLLYKPGTDDELFVETDPMRLKQVITNLLTNAIKFTEEGKIEFGYRVTGEQVLFFCSDTGIGMTSEQQKQIFQRFIKIENAGNGHYKGTGLGLAITKNLVKLLGGRIWVESEPKIGSTFYFTLPNQN